MSAFARVTRGDARPRLSRPVAIALAVVLTASGAVATSLPAAAADAPDVPTVFISQVIGSTDTQYQGSTNTTMRTATQSRLANAGAGGVEISSLTTAAAFTYNAVGYRTADDTLYGIKYPSSNVLVGIGLDGVATELGAIAGLPTSDSYVAGAFGEGEHADTFFVRGLAATAPLFEVDLYDDGGNLNPTVRRGYGLSQQISLWDFTSAYGYLWAVDSNKGIVRIQPGTGTVTRVTPGFFPTGDSSGYGAAWTYGNGNLAFSSNGSGNITQIKVTDPAATTPTFTRVSSILGPPTGNNDGATSPSAPTDLEITVTQPAPAASSSPIAWTVAVTNNGPGGSSGGTFSFPVPSGVTGVALPVGCTQATGVVQCVTDPLPAGTGDTYHFTALSPATMVLSSSSTITIVGNELDPNDDTARLVVAAQPRDRSSFGAGTVLQRASTGAPTGATVAFVVGGTQVASHTVPNVGTFAVDGTDVTFKPAPGYLGQSSLPFAVTHGGETGSGTYTSTVGSPAAPVAPDQVSTGVGTAVQTALVPAAPEGGTVALVNADGEQTYEPITTAAGTYTLDPSATTSLGAPATAIRFAPALGYTGATSSIVYRVTDSYGQRADGAYTPEVVAPAAPTAVPFTSTGIGTDVQRPAAPATVPVGGSVTLVDAEGDDVGSIVVPGQGTATVSPDGVFSFTPVHGYAGTPDAFAYVLTDAYGARSNVSTYSPQVLAPAAPTAVPLTSSGVGTAGQATSPVVPQGGSWRMLDAAGTPVTTITVPGEGVYAVVGHEIRFTPVLGFQGDAAPVAYEVTDAYGQVAANDYVATVVPPAAPVAPAAGSSGVGTNPQATQIVVPVGGSVDLLDRDGAPSAVVVVDGEGTYTLDPVSGEVTFEALFGFAGTATPVTYRVTDAYGQQGTNTYAALVLPPAAPAPAAVDSSGVATDLHTITVAVPQGGTVLLTGADGDPTTAVNVPGVGTYEVDPTTGTLTFVPILGYVGTALIEYQVTDAYGQVGTSTYEPTVTAPAPPAPTPATSTGAHGARQTSGDVVVIPEGGGVALLDASGDAVTRVVVAGEGVYEIDPTTGVITFTPADGFSGTATPATYQVTDAYGQTGVSTYTPTVGGLPAVDEPGDDGIDGPGDEPADEPAGDPADEPVDREPRLPQTGAESLLLAGLAAALVIAGTVLMQARRRLQH